MEGDEWNECMCIDILIIDGGVAHMLVNYVKPRLVSSDRVGGVGGASLHLDLLFTFKTSLTENQEP